MLSPYIPIVLTDRGSEFQAPQELEQNASGKKNPIFIIVINIVLGKRE